MAKAKSVVPLYVRAVRHVLTEATRGMWRFAWQTEESQVEESVYRPSYTVRLAKGYRLKWHAVGRGVVGKLEPAVRLLCEAGLSILTEVPCGPYAGLNVYLGNEGPKWLYNPELVAVALNGDHGPMRDWLLDHGIECSGAAGVLLVRLVRYMANEEEV